MTRKKTTTRLLALLMSALMLLGCIPDTGLIANAADDEAGWIEAGDADVTDDADADDGTADPAEGLLNELDLGDLIVDEYEDDNDPATYGVWIGDVQITETNKDDVLGDGKVSFDPASHTLTLKNAVLDKMTTKEGGAPSASVNICARETLVIKGSAKLTNAYNSIVVGPESLWAKEMPSLTIDADLDIDAVNSGISTMFVPVYINGGNISVKSGIAGILGTLGDVTAKGGKLKLTGAMIGIMSSRALIINGAAIEAEGSQGAVMANSAPDSTIEIYSPSFIEEPAGTTIAAVTIDGKKGQAVVDKNGNPVKNIKIGLNSVTEKVTVTFNQNGHGLTAIPPRVIGKGDKVCAPPEPLDNDWTFAGWYTEAACTNEYDFNSSVDADMTLYAKWKSAWPDPVYGSDSPIDPIPTVIPGKTYELYLVKGQKFNIGKGWYLDKEDEDYKSGKSVVSISKKGVLSVKKAGEATITCGEKTKHKVKIYAIAPKFDKKTVKLTIEDPGIVVKETLNFDYDNNKYDVLWYSSNPDVCTVNKGVVRTAGSKGTSKITAYINGCAFSCKVSVKEKVAAAHRVIHMATGSTKTINIKGFKNPEWSVPDNSNISFIKKNKIKAGETAGKTTIEAYSESLRCMYTIDVYVEDLTLRDELNLVQPEKGKNKYKLSITAGEGTQLLFSTYQHIVMKSNKPDIAFVDDDGMLTARSAGKCKLTTKIDGKTITLNVEVKAAE